MTRFSIGCALALVLTCVVTTVERAHAVAVLSRWNIGNGDWDDPTQWDTNPFYPDNGNGAPTYDATMLSGTATVDVDVTIEALTLGGTLIVEGPDVTFTANGPTNIDGASLFADDGGVVDVLGVTDYSGPVPVSWRTFRADGSGAALNLANLTSVGADGQSLLNLQAYHGGSIDMHNVAIWHAGRAQIEARGAGSTVNLQGLTSVIPGSWIKATLGGTVMLGDITEWNYIDLTLDATGVIDTDQIRTYTGGTITLTDRSLNLIGLEDMDGASLIVNGTGTLTVPPAVTDYSMLVGWGTFQADGSGAVLNLANLTSIGADRQSFLRLQAYAGGSIDLRSVASWWKGGGSFKALGAGSLVDLRSLPESTSLSISTIDARSGGRINLGSAGLWAVLADTSTDLRSGTVDAGSLVLWTGGELDLASDLNMTGSAGQINSLNLVKKRLMFYGPDVLSVDGDLAMAADAKYTASLAGAESSLIAVTGDGLSYGADALTLTIDHDLLGGDADLDGKVWLADWATLRSNFGNDGTGMSWADGNFDPWTDDKVWLSDWSVLRANFSNSGLAASGAANVPEPGTLAMLLGGLAAFTLLGWRRRSGDRY